MIRQYDFHDEVHYVVRLADGRPLAVPAWMTRPEAAGTRIVSHQFPIPGIKPEKDLMIESEETGQQHRILLYRLPLKEQETE